MDYEKKYNEALKRAKAAIDVAADRDLVKGVATTIFPELRESEDERIRKELIELVRETVNGPNRGGITVNKEEKYIAWLERQKINTEGDFGRGYDCGYQAGYAVAMNEMKPKVATATLDSEKQKEQKPAEWSEEDEKMLDEVLDCVTYAFFDQGKEGEIEDDPAFLWLHSLRPSWKPSEEQMEALEECGECKRCIKDLYEQLKELI